MEIYQDHQGYEGSYRAIKLVVRVERVYIIGKSKGG
jgi:hypothetical protein